MYEHILAYYAHIVEICEERYPIGRLHYLRRAAIKQFSNTQDDAQ